jgi:hypothetical protein
MTYAPSKIARDDDFSSLVLHLREVVRANKPEYDPNGKGKPPSRIMNDG